MAGERRVDGFARGAIVCEEEDAIRGRGLDTRNGERIAVVEADVAVEVAHFVGVEGHVLVVLGGCVDEDALAAGLDDRAHFVDGDDASVEELVLHDGGADPQEIALGDLEVLGLFAPRIAVRDADRDVGAIDAARQSDSAKELGELAHFAVGAGDDKARGGGVVLAKGDPVLGEMGERVFVGRFEVESAALGIGVDGGAGVALADRLRCLGLPALARVVATVRQQLVVLRFAHELDAASGGLRSLTEPPGGEVLEVRALAADGFDLGRTNLVDHEAKAGAGLDGLELVEVADEQDLGAGALGDFKHGAHLPDRERSGLVDDEKGLVVENGVTGVDLGEEAREAVGLGAGLVGEVERCAP